MNRDIYIYLFHGHGNRPLLKRTNLLNIELIEHSNARYSGHRFHFKIVHYHVSHNTFHKTSLRSGPHLGRRWGHVGQKTGDGTVAVRTSGSWVVGAASATIVTDIEPFLATRRVVREREDRRRGRGDRGLGLQENVLVDVGLDISLAELLEAVVELAESPDHGVAGQEPYHSPHGERQKGEEKVSEFLAGFGEKDFLAF